MGPSTPTMLPAVTPVLGEVDGVGSVEVAELVSGCPWFRDDCLDPAAVSSVGVDEVIGPSRGWVVSAVVMGGVGNVITEYSQSVDGSSVIVIVEIIVVMISGSSGLHRASPTTPLLAAVDVIVNIDVNVDIVVNEGGGGREATQVVASEIICM